jgi:predicted RNase H-like nuclease
MNMLLVGFDSAWTADRRGALIGVVVRDDGTREELGPPRIANFREADRIVIDWETAHSPTFTLVFLDQPTIVENSVWQRPVEKIVGSAVSRRYGGMQPANTSRDEMFGRTAPVWTFLDRFGGPANFSGSRCTTGVVETYPALTLIALGWTLPDSRPTGRLPKYNPERRTFSRSDWEYVCRFVCTAFSERGLVEIARWVDDQVSNGSLRKEDQDCLDACLCLLVALYLAEGRECLMVGNQGRGYIVVPYSADLRAELECRCRATARNPSEWVRGVYLADGFLCIT